MSGTVMKDSISDRAGDGLGDGVREEEPAPQEVFRPGEGEGVGRDAVEQAQVPHRRFGTRPLALVASLGERILPSKRTMSEGVQARHRGRPAAFHAAWVRRQCSRNSSGVA